MALGSIVIDLLLKTGAFDTDTKKAERRLRELGKEAKIAGAVIGGVLAASFTVFMRNTMAAEKEQAQLAAALKSTGEAAGFSQARLNDMATQMSRATTISAGEITEAQTRLLSYSGIVGDQFPRALQLAIDQSVRLGESLTQSAETVGKALEYPAEGISALTKQGFRFSEEQKKVLKALADTGRLAEAQAIVMDVMEESYAGAAAAARDTFGGALAGLRNTLNDLMTGQGGSLNGATEAVNSLIDTLNDPAVMSGFNNIFNGAIKAIDGLTRFATTTVNIVKWLGEEVAARLHGPALDDTVRIEQAIERQKRLIAEFDRSQDNRGAPMAGYDPATGRGARHFNSSLEAERRKLRDLQAQLKLSQEMAEQAARMAAIKPPAPGAGATSPNHAGLDLRTDAERRKAAADAARERAKAERELEEAIRNSEKAERDLLDAMLENEQIRMGWLTQMENLSAELAGPAAEAALQFGRAVAAADAALKTGAITTEEHRQYVENLGKQYDATIEKIDESAKKLSVFGEQAARNIQSFLGDATYQVLDGNFKSIADSFSDMLKRMMAELAASKILEMLSQWGGQQGGFWGGVFGSLSGQRANGGNVASGGTYLVGERGPELLRMGGQGGTVVPNHALGGGGVNVQIINNGPPVQAQASRSQGPDGSEIIKLVLSAVAEDVGGGGMVAGAMKGRFGLREAM